MKIHKINLENYYRNVIDSAIAVLSHLPEAVFAGRPTFNNALLRFNDGEAPVLMLPKWSDIEIDLSQHKPAWAPASLTGTIKVSITPSVVGVEASADETSLGSFDVYGVTGTSTGKQYSVTEGKYTIEYAVSILDGEDNPVVVFSNGQALKVVMEKVADNGPDTTLDIGGGGGGSFTQEQADWNQSDDTKVDYIKNKPTIPAAQVNADWNADSGVAQILNKPTIPAAPVNADWNAESGLAQILNKPTIPTVNNATLTLTQGTTTLGTFTANASTDVTVDIPAGGGGGASIIEKTWSELKAMRDGGTLTPGQTYRITDYTCTTTQSSTSSAGNVFDILVVADDASHLNEKARAARHSGDTYFPNWTKFEAWQLWYCIDNDTNRFGWADSTNGKGVIYRMIDERNNDLPFDFKNIKAYGHYTFSMGRFSTDDRSITISVHDNKIGLWINKNEGGKRFLNKVTVYTEYDHVYGITMGCNCHDIHIGVVSPGNTFGDGCFGINIGNRSANNHFGNDCCNINIGKGRDVTSDVMWNSNNTFGDGCQYIYFGTSGTIRGAYTGITVERNNSYIYLDCDTTSGPYKNVTIAKGTNSTSPYLTITDSNVNQAYQTTFCMEPNGTLSKIEGSGLAAVNQALNQVVNG